MNSNHLVIYPQNHFSNSAIKGICLCSVWVIFIFAILLFASIDLGIDKTKSYDKENCFLVSKDIGNDFIVWNVNVIFSNDNIELFQIKKNDLSISKLRKLDEKYLVNQTYSCYYHHNKIYWNDYNTNNIRNVISILIIVILAPLCLFSCAILLFFLIRDYINSNNLEDIPENNLDEIKKNDGEKYEGFVDNV